VLTKSLLPREAAWFVPLLLLVIRPVSVGLGLLGTRMSRSQRRLTSWFGIRGIGSIYYMFAITHGLTEVDSPH
jgi:NhaP-type Na+/H+ or K+/H+ antiporter